MGGRGGGPGPRSLLMRWDARQLSGFLDNKQVARSSASPDNMVFRFRQGTKQISVVTPQFTLLTTMLASRYFRKGSKDQYKGRCLIDIAAIESSHPPT